MTENTLKASEDSDVHIFFRDLEKLCCMSFTHHTQSETACSRPILVQ